MIWFTADTHFWHRGALNFRPWHDVETMNQVLIKGWNEDVKPTDSVYHLGDLSFAGIEKTVEVVGQLNGRIHVVPGNHDDPKLMRRLVDLNLITLLPPLYDLKVTTGPAGAPARFTLCHFPLMSWNRMHYGALHLHGHCHGHLGDDGVSRRMDVGIDTGPGGCSLYPLELVRERLEPRAGRYHDHHQPENTDAAIP